ncbi:alpha/beta-hydrolase [Trematosphaeria pertusa]|uniref:Alpha/beta-hydrolase n=1 Tax=Trematosphaeria pertusa TaxID=390896 RepID=A0A6A6J397_9PLEO|nr:alpha/beta-hydrolase [Trematosphaeria pertusa]KAF2257106.1 alpha/beta-hydrolase [Trematosphaeria pertusa]
MSTESTQSKACCDTPAVVTKGYQPKGDYITVDGLKTYATGPKDAKKGILVVYDIFGFFPQTLQGADILAYTDKDSQYQVFIPDFFEGEPADISWYPPDNEEKGKKLGEFFKAKAAPPKTLPRIPKIVEELKKSKGVETWGMVGYCWGGKIVNLSSMEGTPFKAAASCHPAMVAGDDAPGVTIPFAMLPSKDESKEDVEKWQQGIKVPHLVEWFPDQVHGWMAARGDLEDEKVKKEYERGYKIVLDFFHKHM